MSRLTKLIRVKGDEKHNCQTVHNKCVSALLDKLSTNICIYLTTTCSNCILGIGLDQTNNFTLTLTNLTGNDDDQATD